MTALTIHILCCCRHPACHGGHCKGEGEVDGATALTIHVCCRHWHCCHMWRNEVGKDDARHHRRHHVWRDEASVVHHHCHVWMSVEGEVSGGEASSSC